METHESTDKFLNLVYDKWEGNSEIYNCADSTENLSFNDVSGFIDFYERYYFEHLNFPRHPFPIKKWKIEDVYKNPNKKFYYAIKTGFGFNELIESRNFDLSNTVKQCFKNCKNIFFLHIREHESEFIQDLESLNKYLEKHNLPKNQFVLINNGSKVAELNKKYNSAILNYKLNLIQITSSSIFAEMNSNYIEEKSGKFFLCFNKNPKKHRYGLICALDYFDILKDTNWSLIAKTDESDFTRFKDFFIKDLYNKINFKKFKDVSLKESDFENGKGFFNDDMTVNYQDFPELERGGGASGGLMIPEFSYIYENSYFNIVTESIFEDMFDVIHITEKSIRPFYFYMFPIFVATKGHVKKMREEFDFDFFDDIIDHGYDDIDDQKERLTFVVNEINRIYNNKELFIEFYIKNKYRFEKNKQKVIELSNDVTDYNFFKSLLS